MSGDEDEKDEPKATTSRVSEYEKRNGRGSESGSRSSGSCSSVVEMEEAKASSGPVLGTKKMRLEKKKRVRRAAGRVEKRKRTRRAKRKPKSRMPKLRELSTSTVYARRRSLTPEQERLAPHICKHCGHRCCQRRYEYKRRRYQKTNPKRTNARNHQLKTTSGMDNLLASVGIQAGSRCAMLSSLCISSFNDELSTEPEKLYCQITPEMIHQSLRILTMWREGARTEAIYDYIRVNYPVNTNADEVAEELLEKLEIACLSGIVWALPNNCWRLTSIFEKLNKLDKSHVTLFWRMYGDTLKPLDKKQALRLKKSDKMTGTEETSNKLPITIHDYDLV